MSCPTISNCHCFSCQPLQMVRKHPLATALYCIALVAVVVFLVLDLLSRDEKLMMAGSYLGAHLIASMIACYNKSSTRVTSAKGTTSSPKQLSKVDKLMNLLNGEKFEECETANFHDIFRNQENYKPLIKSQGNWYIKIVEKGIIDPLVCYIELKGQQKIEVCIRYSGEEPTPTTVTRSKTTTDPSFTGTIHMRDFSQNIIYSNLKALFAERHEKFAIHKGPVYVTES